MSGQDLAHGLFHELLLVLNSYLLLYALRNVPLHRNVFGHFPERKHVPEHHLIYSYLGSIIVKYIQEKLITWAVKWITIIMIPRREFNLKVGFTRFTFFEINLGMLGPIVECLSDSHSTY